MRMCFDEETFEIFNRALSCIICCLGLSILILMQENDEHVNDDDEKFAFLADNRMRDLEHLLDFDLKFGW